MLGYTIICIALVLFVQAKNVYPQLLMGRLLFSLGGAAASTMVTAVLPTMSFVNQPSHGLGSGMPESTRPSAILEDSGRAPSPSISSELTVTPARYRSRSGQRVSANGVRSSSAEELRSSSSKIAGYVGMFAGCGALLALGLFLPLPARFQRMGISPNHALQYSYYIVAGVAIAVALICLVGLRRLQGESGKTWRNLIPLRNREEDRPADRKAVSISLWRYFSKAVMLGFQNSDIGLGYLGGFVARASSVGISLFIPLLINACFLSSGLCSIDGRDTPGGLPDIKRRCPQAYVLAAEMTGVSQLVALLCAPAFGYISARIGTHSPLLLASAAGIIGYPIFATQFSPDDTDRGRRFVTFFSVCLIGISQIGAIVCSLATLSSGVLQHSSHQDINRISNDNVRESVQGHVPEHEESRTGSSERTGLVSGAQVDDVLQISEIKGSIAGMYSLYGGAGILLLTKLGGTLFDKVSFGAPFYIMAVFNAILMVGCLAIKVAQRLALSRKGSL